MGQEFRWVEKQKTRVKKCLCWYSASYLTPSANRELSELAFHIRARRVVAFIVAKGVVLVVDHLAVDVVVARDAQLPKVLKVDQR